MDKFELQNEVPYNFSHSTQHVGATNPSLVSPSPMFGWSVNLIRSVILSPWPKKHQNFIPTPYSIYIHCCTNLELVKFGGLVWLKNGGSVFELLMFITFSVVGWMWLASIPSNEVRMFSVVVLLIHENPNLVRPSLFTVNLN